MEIEETDAGDSDNEWSDYVCAEISLRNSFPAYVLDLDVQKNVITRFLDFYIRGKLPKGMTVGDLVFPVISVMPENVLYEFPLFLPAEFNKDGTLFSLTANDIQLAKTNSPESAWSLHSSDEPNLETMETEGDWNNKNYEVTVDVEQNVGENIPGEILEQEQNVNNEEMFADQFNQPSTSKSYVERQKEESSVLHKLTVHDTNDNGNMVKNSTNETKTMCAKKIGTSDIASNIEERLERESCLSAVSHIDEQQESNREDEAWDLSGDDVVTYFESGETNIEALPSCSFASDIQGIKLPDNKSDNNEISCEIENKNNNIKLEEKPIENNIEFDHEKPINKLSEDINLSDLNISKNNNDPWEDIDDSDEEIKLEDLEYLPYSSYPHRSSESKSKPKPIKWYGYKSKPKPQGSIDIVYRPVDNNRFISFCEDMLDKWKTHDEARHLLKYFFGIVALTLMRGLTKSYRQILNAFSSHKFALHITIINSSFEVFMDYAPPNKDCISKCYRAFRENDEKTRIVFAKILKYSCLYLESTSLTNMYHVALLSNIANYKMELAAMVQTIANSLGRINLNRIIAITYCDETAESWKKLKAYVYKYLIDVIEDDDDRMHHWARIFDDKYFKDLDCKDNYPLAVILAVFNEKINGDRGIWRARWVEEDEMQSATDKIRLEKYKELGRKMYEKFVSENRQVLHTIENRSPWEL